MTVPRHHPPALDAIGPPRPSTHRASLDARLLTPASTSSASSRRSFFADFATLLRSHRKYKPDITTPEFFSEYAGQQPLPPNTMHTERPSRDQKPGNKLYSFLTRSRSRSRSKPDPPAVHAPGSKPATRIPSRPLSSTTTATNTTVTQNRKQRAPPPPDPPSRPSTSGGGARQKLHDLFGIALSRKNSTSRSRSRPSSPVATVDVPPLPTHDDDNTPRSRKPYSQRASPTPVLRVTNATTTTTTTTTSSTGSTAASIKISKFFSNPPPTSSPTLPPIPTFVSRVSSLHRRSAKDPDNTPPAPTPPPKIVHTPPTPLRSGPSSGTVSASTSGSSHAPASSTTATSAGSLTPRPGHVPKGSLDSNYRYRGGAFPMRAVAEEGSTPPPGASDAGHSLAKAKPVPRPPLTKMSSSARATKHGSFDFERPGWGGAAGGGAVAMQRTGSGGTTGTSTSASAGSKRSALGMDAVARERERESVYGPGLAGVGTLQREASMRRAQEREDLLRTKERGRKGDKGKDKDKDKDRDRTRSQRTTPDTVHASTSSASAAANANGKSSSIGRAAGRRTIPLLPKRLLAGLAGAHHGPFAFEPAVPASARAQSPGRSTGSASTGTAHEVVLPAARAERERARLREEKERAGRVRSGFFGGGGAGNGAGGLGGMRRSGDRAPVPVPMPTIVPPVYASGVPEHKHKHEPASPGPIAVQMPLTLSAVLEGVSTSPASRENGLGHGKELGYENAHGQAQGGGSMGRTTTTRAPRPAPGHRSGTKGRSLDLGLGLMWAPSKVREEALLLPKSAFFTRTASTGSQDRAGRGGSGSGTGVGGDGTAGTGAGRAGDTMVRTASGASGRSGLGAGLGRSASVAQTERDVERAKLGREVAEVFRGALDGEGYKLFKNYVHQFDAHEIPFDGPLGIVARVEGLLAGAPVRMGEGARRSLLDKFVRIILQVA